MALVLSCNLLACRKIPTVVVSLGDFSRSLIEYRHRHKRRLSVKYPPIPARVQ
jgi:hypothetical protein